MITPDRQKALQEYLLSQNLAERIGFMKVEAGDGPAIVFNEGEWGYPDVIQDYEKGIDIFPVLIDVVVKYEDYKTGYDIRYKIRELLGKFNGQLTNDWEGTIAFRQFLSPSYNHDTNEIILGGIYLLKQNYDYEVIPTPTPTETLTNEEENNANNPD